METLKGIFKSKKIWYCVGSLVVPAAANQIGADETTIQNIWGSIIALILGQGVADAGKYFNLSK